MIKPLSVQTQDNIRLKSFRRFEHRVVSLSIHPAACVDYTAGMVDLLVVVAFVIIEILHSGDESRVQLEIGVWSCVAVVVDDWCFRIESLK